MMRQQRTSSGHHHLKLMPSRPLVPTTTTFQSPSVRSSTSRGAEEGRIHEFIKATQQELSIGAVSHRSIISSEVTSKSNYKNATKNRNPISSRPRTADAIYRSRTSTTATTSSGKAKAMTQRNARIGKRNAPLERKVSPEVQKRQNKTNPSTQSSKWANLAAYATTTDHSKKRFAIGSKKIGKAKQIEIRPQSAPTRSSSQHQVKQDDLTRNDPCLWASSGYSRTSEYEFYDQEERKEEESIDSLPDSQENLALEPQSERTKSVNIRWRDRHQELEQPSLCNILFFYFHDAPAEIQSSKPCETNQTSSRPHTPRGILKRESAYKPDRVQDLDFSTYQVDEQEDLEGPDEDGEFREDSLVGRNTLFNSAPFRTIRQVQLDWAYSCLEDEDLSMPLF